MRVQVQLTFEEYEEALRLVRKEFLVEIRRRIRAEIWIGTVVILALVFVLSRLFDRMIPSRTVVPLGESLRPYIFGLVIVWLIIIALRMHAGRRMKLIDRLSFEGRPQLHQVRTYDFTDAGVTVTDAFSRTDYYWRIFRRVEETTNTLVLYVSDYTFEIIPKRALPNPGEVDRLRAILTAKIEPQIKAFPVVSTQPLPPPPLPAEEAAP